MHRPSLISFVTEKRIIEAIRYLTIVSNIDDSVRDKFIRNIKKQMKDNRDGPNSPWPKLSSYKCIQKDFQLTEDFIINFSGWCSANGLDIGLYNRNRNPHIRTEWVKLVEVTLSYDATYDWEKKTKLIGIHDSKPN